MRLRDQETGDDTIHHLLEDVTDTIEQARKWREDQSRLDADFDKLLQVTSPIQDEAPSEDYVRQEPEREVIRCEVRADKLDVDSLLRLDQKCQVNYSSAQLDTSALTLINSQLHSELSEVDLDQVEGERSEPAEKDEKLWGTVDSIERELKELEDMMSTVNLRL
jgi:hypothetical protein